MRIGIGPARLGFFVAAVAAVLVGTALLSGATAHAQNPPATYYGVATAGDEISATIDGTVCEAVTADSNGEWVIVIQESGCDGNAVAGATVQLWLNGEGADQSETWEAGGAPADLVSGISLTVMGGGDMGGGGTPAPPDTGNAGFAFSEGGASPWLALSLGLFALAGVAGLRFATRRVS